MEHRFETPEEPAPGAVPAPSPEAPSSEGQPQGQTQEAAFTPLEQSAAAGAIADTGWSWGAFLFGPLFIVAIRRYSFLFWYLLMFVPIVNFFALFGLPIYLGIYGRGMAAQSKSFSNRDEYIGYMKATDHSGKVFTILYLIALVGAVAVTVLAVLAGARNFSLEEPPYERTMEFETQYNYDYDF